MDQKALAFAQESIVALGEGDVPTARTCIAQACDVDAALHHLADAVYLACADLENDGVVSVSTWNSLGDAVGSSDLLAVVEAYRSA